MSTHQAPNSGTYHLCKSVSSPSILKKCGAKSINNVPGRKVHFDLFNNIKIMLLNYNRNNDEDKIYYNNLICDIRDSATEIKDFELLKLLQDARNCINILNENLKLFVKVILILKWMNRSDEVVNEYRAFLLEVCTAHNYYTKFAIEQLVACFSQVDNAVYDRVNSMPSEEEERGYLNVHRILDALLKVVPLAKDLLMPAFQNKFPYKNNSADSHLHYVHNLLYVTKYEPSLRKDILSLIIKKLVEIDVHISKDELDRLESNVNIETDNIFSMDIDDNIQGKPNKTETQCFSHTIDICLLRLFVYMKTTCHNIVDSLVWDNTKSLYHDLLSVFENEILPTYNSCYIQYVIYYFLSFKMTLADNFSNWLWKKCCDVSSPITLRQAAAGYLASFLCRAPFVSNNVLKNILSEIAFWCNNYINNVDKSVKVVTEELLREHAVFYSICQAMFYIISFRHQDLMDSKRNLKFMENLRLSKIVTCKLNPLRLCCSKVVDHFAYITKIYQLTYCYSVMDSHIRITDQTIKDEWLYSFFPFGPYVLPRSKNLITPDLYRNIEIDFLNFSKTTGNISHIVSSLPDNNMDISPSMVLSPSPGKIDWLGQFVYDSNKPIFHQYYFTLLFFVLP
ncbi:RNA polymerase I specific transcription initiation factor RRN3 [Cinara cedri]|uniref:RNA polymerase I specific transcription initiation factor RRN3 n=1 Tax=Cinara cedri TaxID=506608 RepID=A0A5E4MKQ5_9HEMI|nr:RNA polymerase I specific transcription initiation factor RRN3 [Cinara cedri]